MPGRYMHCFKYSNFNNIDGHFGPCFNSSFTVLMGYNVHTNNKIKETVLHVSVRNNHEHIVKYLIGENVDLGIKGGEPGSTVVHLASSMGFLNILHILSENKCNLSMMNERNETPLYLSVQNNHIKIVKYLLSQNVDVNQPGGQNDSTPVNVASLNNNLDVLQFLVGEYNANVNIINNRNETPLLTSVFQNHTETVQYLLLIKHM